MILEKASMTSFDTHDSLLFKSSDDLENKLFKLYFESISVLNMYDGYTYCTYYVSEEEHSVFMFPLIDLSNDT